MALLSRAAILEAEDRETVDIECPEWDGTVRLRSITGRERDAYEQSCIVGKGKNRDLNMRNARAKLILLCAVDGQGGRLFGDDDLAALGRKNARPIDRLFEAAQKLCGLRDEDVDELVEDFEAADQS